MQKIFLGTAGLGGYKEAEENLKKIHFLGLTACEIAFTYRDGYKSHLDNFLR